MRTFHLVAILIATTTVMSGCATKKNFYAMGGSRADGTVDMAYDFREFESPVVDVNQAQRIAQSKCQVWGYQSAEAFGGQRQQCYKFDGFGSCAAGQVVIQYQCLGSGDRGAITSALAPSATAGAADSSGALNREQWKQQQLDELARKSMPYEQYQQEYRRIMGQ